MAGDALAHELTALYAAVFGRFHRRRDAGEPTLARAQWAVLEHLSRSGPLTVGEMSQHLDRAQSVVSAIVDRLVDKGLLERVRDARDRRRVLVWLSDLGLARLARERQVLDVARVAAAIETMTTAERDALLVGLRALVRAGDVHAARTTARATKTSRTSVTSKPKGR